jgi:putative hydrolase of the HAD superfamily
VTVRALFWDVGGVLLSNAWDRTQRLSALEHFRLDEEEFHSRHEMVVSSFERGKITLDEYLDRTVFYRTRSFTPARRSRISCSPYRSLSRRC